MVKQANFFLTLNAFSRKLKIAFFFYLYNVRYLANQVSVNLFIGHILDRIVKSVYLSKYRLRIIYKRVLQFSDYYDGRFIIYIVIKFAKNFTVLTLI
jgi:hypothetical protein